MNAGHGGRLPGRPHSPFPTGTSGAAASSHNPSGTVQRVQRYRSANRITLEEQVLLYWSLLFLIVALVAAVFGFGGIASTAAGIAQVLFVVALVLFIVSLFAGARRRNL